MTKETNEIRIRDRIINKGGKGERCRAGRAAFYSHEVSPLPIPNVFLFRLLFLNAFEIV